MQEILLSVEKGLDFGKQIDKMDRNNRLYGVVKAFSELDLSPVTIDSIKMGYIFEELIRKFSENAEAGDHYTGRDIIKTMVSILMAEGATTYLKTGKLSLSWIRPAAQVACYLQPGTIFTDTTPAQTSGSSVKKSTRSPMRCASQKC